MGLPTVWIVWEKRSHPQRLANRSGLFPVGGWFEEVLSRTEIRLLAVDLYFRQENGGGAR